MRKIGLRLRSASDIRWLSEAEASHYSFKIAICTGYLIFIPKFGKFGK
jgi:hypothetical protein